MSESYGYILQVLTSVERTTRKNNYAAICPYCGKGKQHFRIDVQTGLWRCFKCDERGNAFTLLQFLGRLDLFFNQDKPLVKQRVDISFEEEELENVELPKTVSLPVGCRRVFSNEYLESRGFSKEDFERNEVYKTRLLERFKNYIIMPVRMRGEVKGYISRVEYSKEELKVLESKTGVEIRRYLNGPTGADFKNMLDGYDDIVVGETRTVILVEGKFDRIATNKKLNLFSTSSVRCCSLSGKAIGETAIKLLKLARIDSVILMLDVDALKELLAYSIELFHIFETKVALLKNKDPDECSQAELQEILLNLRNPLTLNLSTVTIKLK